MGETVTESVEGFCEEISEKNGWTTFSINIGRQYPVRVDTKLPHLIEAARALGNEHATWTFKKSEGAINPNSGKPYINRLLEKAEAGSSAPDSSPGTAGAIERDTFKDRRISRLACLRTASTLTPHLAIPPDGDVVSAVVGAALRLENWVYRDQDPVPSSSGSEQPPPDGEDDGIPFVCSAPPFDMDGIAIPHVENWTSSNLRLW